MSARIKSDLLLVDGALRTCPSRTLLKGGSVDAWAACNASLHALLPIFRGSILADQGGSAPAVAMHWRKSSVSKKLLALLREVVEDSPALRSVAAHATSARTVRCRAVHGSIGVISFFWELSKQSAALWPAISEWIIELGGVTSLWAALAWVILIPMQDFGAAADAMHQLLRVSVHEVFALTHDMFSFFRRPVELKQNSAVITVLSRLLSDLLPRDFAAGNAQQWDLDVVSCTISALCEFEGSAGGVLSAHLHRPLLAFWPHLIAAMGRQQRILPKSAGASVPQEDSPLGQLKVHINIFTPDFRSLFHKLSVLYYSVYLGSGTCQGLNTSSIASHYLSTGLLPRLVRLDQLANHGSSAVLLGSSLGLLRRRAGAACSGIRIYPRWGPPCCGGRRGGHHRRRLEGRCCRADGRLVLAGWVMSIICTMHHRAPHEVSLYPSLCPRSPSVLSSAELPLLCRALLINSHSDGTRGGLIYDAINPSSCT